MGGCFYPECFLGGRFGFHKYSFLKKTLQCFSKSIKIDIPFFSKLFTCKIIEPFQNTMLNFYHVKFLQMAALQKPLKMASIRNAKIMINYSIIKYDIF